MVVQNRRVVHPPPPDPSEGIAPAVVPLELILGRSDSVAVLLPELLVYPGGTLWPVLLQARTPGIAADVLRSFWPAPPPDYPDERRPPCELSLRFPDARTARLVGTRGRGPTGGELGIWSKGSRGGGSGLSFHATYFIAPLPGPGAITVSCEWPMHRIPATETAIDTTAIVGAARRAQELWQSR